jgi:hypothetical protein
MFRRFCRRRAILRHDPGLAAIPPVCTTIRAARRVVPRSPLLSAVDSQAPRRRGAPRTAVSRANHTTGERHGWVFPCFGALDGGLVERRNPERAQGLGESADVRQDEQPTRVQDHRVERQRGAQRRAGWPSATVANGRGERQPRMSRL